MKVLSLGFLLALAAASLWGQATAQIHGVVQDTSGSAVPGATVKATQTETGISRSVVTEADGVYVIASLPLGPYQIEATKEGFATFVQTGVVLQVGSDPAIPVAMKVGAVTERVSVEANVTQVETTSLSVGSVVENQRVLDLPLNGRNPNDLIALGGAAVVARSGSNLKGSYSIVVAGGAYFGVEYKLDGAVHDNFWDGTGMPLPFPDALQEFKISTSTQDPDNSGRSSATVNAVMKSGSNAFHGDMFEFIRNSDLNARDFFATGRDGLKRNQFGGTVGGRIVKDKLFFFAGYQGTTTRVATAANTAFVPTAAMLQGNFAPYVAAGCIGKNLGAPYGQNGNAPNTVAPGQLSPVAVAIVTKYLPTPINACGQIPSYAIPNHENDNEGDFRIDYQLSEKQSLFVRNMIARQDVAVPYTLEPQNIFAANTGGSNALIESFTLGDTYVLSPTKVNSLRLYLDRVSTNDPPIHTFGPKDVGQPIFSYIPNFFHVNAGSSFLLGGAFNVEDSFTHMTAFGANDDFRIVHGAHQFAFGGSFTRTIVWGVANAYSGGLNYFGSTSGSILSDFMLGTESFFEQGNPNPVNTSQPLIGLYAQDTWKITPKLTMTYGVNWNPFFGMRFQQGDLSGFNLTNYFADVTSKVVAGAPPGFTFPGDPGFPGKSGINASYNKFDPRFGLAWDPFGDGKTAIRIGGGIANDFLPLSIPIQLESSPPFRMNNQFGGVNLTNPYPSGNPFPYNYNPKNPVWPSASVAACLANTCPPVFLPIEPNFKTTGRYSWNLGVQRQVTPKWFLSATYLGSHLIHTWTEVELNPGIYIPGNCVAGQYGLTAPGPCTTSANITQRRVLNMSGIDPSQPLGDITEIDDGGTQGYNGLLVNTNYRLSNGLNVNGNYTWSHCIGLQSNESAPNAGGNYPTDGFGQNVYPQNRNLSVGNCAEDRRNIANISLVYRTPKFSARLARTVLSGWTLGSIVQARSGNSLALTTTNQTDPVTGSGSLSTITQRPNQVLANAYEPTIAPCSATQAFCVRYLNPAAFAVPAIGTSFNLGAYALHGPAFWQWDQTISRSFQIRENQKIEARFEVFNVTNSFRPGNPVLTVGSPTFGEILTDATPPLGVTNPGGPGVGAAGSGNNAPARVLQFALKYVF